MCGIRIQLLTSGLIIACILHPVAGFSQSSDGRKFAEVVHTLANDGLGVDEYQKYVDLKVRHVKEDLNGSKLVDSMALSLSSKFTEWIEAVERLRDVLERGYDDSAVWDHLPECCTAPVREKDVRFKQRVNKEEICVVGAGLRKRAVTYVNREQVLGTMQQNMDAAPSLKWQYFASEQGVLFNYPTLNYCSETYDPRFRPFYVEVASPQPKDLVIVVDTSGSMRKDHEGRTLMQITIEAASTVVDTLGPNDRVGVVAFSHKPQTPPGTVSTSTCYSDSLAMATPKNKHYLIKTFLQNLKESGATNYGPALVKAFQLFTNTDDNPPINGQEREKLVLFLTDGEPTDNKDTIMQTLREENAKLGNKVIMFTFGFGEGTSWQTLQDMAEQTTADKDAGEVKPGHFIRVSNPSDLRSKMGSYYTYISRTGGQPSVIFSVPYKDYFGTGVLISGCLPVYHNRQLKGVVCIDRTVSDLLSDVTYFNKGEHNYAFVIDGEARVLTHPLLPRPQTILDDPLFIRLTSLMRSPEAPDVMISMIRGKTGNLTFSSESVASRGDTKLEGVQTRSLQSTYFWTPIEQTRFSVCVVLAEGAEAYNVVWDTYLPQSFIYHRIDLKPQQKQCSYLHRVSLKDKSSVKFAPIAFVDQYEYMDTEETRTTVDRYELYMLGKSNPVSPDFKEGVRESVASTEHFDAILSTRPARFAIWRYIGTEAGVFRNIPGHQMTKAYDHTQRPWYKRGINRKGVVTFSIPYQDASGAGTVLTLSQSIYQGRSSQYHQTNDPVSAVMGMDFTLPYLYERMLDTYPVCRDPYTRCFLVDSSGFIVIHKDFVEVVPSSNDMIVHISTKEPHIARDLVAKNIMRKAACVNVQDFSNQYFWKISLLIAHNGQVSSPSYTLSEVPGSNVFVVIATGLPSAPPRECSWCDRSDALPHCTSVECNCPCYRPTDIYEYCKDAFSLQGDGWPVCVPQPIVVSLEDLEAEDSDKIGRLVACFNYTCHEDISRSDCIATTSCSWCTHGATNEKLMSPYCSGLGICRDRYTTISPSTPPRVEDYEQDDAVETAVGTIIAAVLIPLVIVLLVLGFFWYRHTHRMPSGQPSAMPAPPTTASTNAAFQMDEYRPPPTAPAFVADPTYTSTSRPEQDAPNIYASIYPDPVAFSGDVHKS